MHGFAWAWAAGWLWGWLIVAVALASLVGGVLRARRYEMEEAQHTAKPRPASPPAPERGSMILAEEHPLEPLPAPVVDAHPWLEQTAADLAPEALDEAPPLSRDLSGDLDAIPPHQIEPEREEIVLPAYGGWVSGPCLDPGPGDAAVEPPASPGPDQPSQWLAEQLAVLRAWSEWQQQKMVVLA